MTTPLAATPAAPPGPNATTRLVVRVVAYYAVVITVLVLALPHLGGADPAARPPAFGAELGAALGGDAAPRAAAGAGLGLTGGGVVLAGTTVAAMLGALVFALPVSWVYLLTRARRGYQQSVVHTLVMLPMVVAGVVVLVRDSVALAFGLAGIVAAVRFRTALDDSKDAVFVFLVVGVGLAAAVNLPVAAALSVCFNAAVLALWRTDFGRTPPQLDGRVAAARLRRARDLSRTGTFVARIDEEVFRDMTAEQLEGVAARAQRRARLHDPDAANGDGAAPEADALLLVRTYDVAAARRAVEPQLDAQAKRWRFGCATPSADGTLVLDYAVELKKGRAGEELVAQVRAANAPEVVGAELG
jgi:hypothetical protein